MRFVRENTGNEDIRRYAPLYDFSVRHPEKFWPLVWEFCGIRASGEFEPVLVDADKMPGARFFPNVKLNFAQNLLRHKDERTALVFRNEWGHKREFTYAELHAEVGRVAHALKEAGVGPGDRVAGFMPNLPETDHRDARRGFARRHLVLVLAGFRHQRRRRPLRPDRAQGAVHGRRLRLRRQALRLPGEDPERARTRFRASRKSSSCPIPATRCSSMVCATRSRGPISQATASMRCRSRCCRSIIRSTSCIRRARPACPNASCTAPAAR